MAPIDARITTRENNLCVWFVMTHRTCVTPNASAQRNIVPRFPGSCISSRINDFELPSPTDSSDNIGVVATPTASGHLPEGNNFFINPCVSMIVATVDPFWLDPSFEAILELTASAAIHISAKGYPASKAARIWVSPSMRNAPS